MEAVPTRADYRWFLSIPTRWMDNDVYGHVNNVVYYSYFDTVVNKMLITEGLLDIERSPTIGLCVESHCSFTAPIIFPETVEAGLLTERQAQAAGVRHTTLISLLVTLAFASAIFIALFRGVHREMLARREAEGARRAGEEYNRSIVDASPDCLAVLTREARVIQMTPQGLRLMEAENSASLSDADWLDEMIELPHVAAESAAPNYMHLMRAARRMFEPDELTVLAPPVRGGQSLAGISPVNANGNSAHTPELDPIEHALVHAGRHQIGRRLVVHEDRNGFVAGRLDDGGGILLEFADAHGVGAQYAVHDFSPKYGSKYSTFSRAVL